MACSTSWSFMKWSWMFCRVVMWPKPREYCSADIGEGLELRRVEDALRDLDAQHLRVARLPLAVGAAHQPERPPLIRRRSRRSRSARASRRSRRSPPRPRRRAACGRGSWDHRVQPWDPPQTLPGSAASAARVREERGRDGRAGLDDVADHDGAGRVRMRPRRRRLCRARRASPIHVSARSVPAARQMRRRRGGGPAARDQERRRCAAREARPMRIDERQRSRRAAIQDGAIRRLGVSRHHQRSPRRGRDA